MAALGIAFLLCLTASVVHSYNNVPLGGNINQLLNCPYDPHTLSFQPKGPGDVWPPHYTWRDLQSFQLVYLDYAILYGHLGPDYDAQFTSISDPTGTSAPLPPDLESSRTMVPNTLLPDSAFNESEKSIIRRFAGDQLGCLLRAEWVNLGRNFWPQWYAGRKCQPIRGNCSLPAGGQQCWPDLSSVDYVTVLAWDACHLPVNNQFVYTFGWRKVRVPMIRRCSCTCDFIPPSPN